MKDKQLENTLEACQKVLKEVKHHADEIRQMHQEMQVMVEQNKQLKSEVTIIRQEEVQQRMLRLASKAAKKAAKKSIAKAKMKERLYPSDK
ncbi:hypothetical protein OS175_13005 [Marinicella sp. S1101]|uniref:hypothetical protein n=1 Tax=Marinicella marina TaxID=2996016 RepID=UPI0022608E72|nr:hypothetical protein [Marinicella marina]MCX7554794.1 hypothetical protein [Marinicella marina]MDJ1140973.1 hypothetical protein [Marinicella marina]